MKYLVTGVCGFIGSHIAQALLNQGNEVLGVDVFTDYYSREIKEKNRFPLDEFNNFTFMEKDVNDLELTDLDGIKVIVHQAAQAGVRKSWGSNFQIYTYHNIQATQKLLELSTLVPLKKFLYASSSSVYGNIASLPATESHLPQPISPYGVSKLAGEQLCNLYYFNYAVPVVSLRYFTVYGPGQRPDMAFHQFIRSILKDEVILIYGDGSQTRDFTYIDDLVDANMSAINTPAIEGKVFNVGGGHRRRLEEVIEIIEDLIGRKARLNYQDRQKGDPRDTWADISQAEKYLSYRPRSSMREGLAKQVEYVNYLLRNKM